MIDPIYLLNLLTDTQKRFLAHERPLEAYRCLLDALLDLTEAKLGFIGEYVKNGGGRIRFEVHASAGLELKGSDNLLEEIARKRGPLICNNPAEFPDSDMLNGESPSIKSFMGLPIYVEEHLIGIAGVANRAEGYTAELATELEPYLGTAASLISVGRFSRQAGRSSQKLEHSEYLQETILNTVVDGIITINEKGIVASFNKSAERIFGYLEKDVIGKNVNMLMPEPYASEHDGYLKRYGETGEAHIIGIGRQVEGRRKDGTVFPMNLAVGGTKTDGERIYTGIVRDISSEVESKLALQSGAARLQAVLDNVIDGIITINKKGIVENFNPAAERIFGYDAQEVIGRNVKMLMPTSFADEHDSYIHNYLTTGQAKIIGIGREVTGLRKNGSTFPMDLAVSKMEIGDSTLFSGIVRDITERKRMETMKNEFISTVSHELRTPLTSIRGSLGLISGGAVGEVPDQIKEMLNIAGNNTERLLLLINDILDIQKIEAGKMAFHFENVRLQDFLEETVKENEGYGSHYGVTYMLKEFPQSICVYADKDRLMQVMANLLSNAAKFSKEGDTVEISVARHKGAIRVSVTDHGSGIPDEYKPSVFEKFSQSDSSDTRAKAGTGLGLSITKLIVEKHGGRIGFVSRVGVGSTFFIELPELMTSVGSITDVMELEGEHRPCVLIVEDDPDVAALLQRMLSEAGFNSDVAYSAKEAKWLLRERGETYKAMTLDIILPDQDGLEMLSSVRSTEQTRNLPVIVVSVKADEAKKELNGSAVDIMDWLSKPIDQERLKQAVKMAAGPRKLPRVLHVEDEQDVHKVVSVMLRNECELVWTTTVEASREVLENEKFDLVLLDIGLPDGSGLDLLDLIEERVKPARVVIFSALDVDESIVNRVNAVLVKSKKDNQLLLDTIISVMRPI